MKHLDLADLVALAAEVSEVDAPKLLELLETPEVLALLAPPHPTRPPHELAGALLVGIVAIAPLPTGSRRLALVAALHLLAVNGLDAELEGEPTRRLLAGIAAGDEDEGSVAAWLDPRVRARDPLDGALADLLAPDAWGAIGLGLGRAHHQDRPRLAPADLLHGLVKYGDGPAAQALGSGGDGARGGQPRTVYRPPPGPVLEPAVCKVFELAFRLSVVFGHPEINGGHLLLALLDAGHEAALPAGLDAVEVRRQVLEDLGPGAPDEDNLTGRLARLTARLRTTDPEAAAELEEVADLQDIGLDRLLEMIRAWRGEIFLEALARDDAVVRLLGLARLGTHGSSAVDDRLLAEYLADLEGYRSMTAAEEGALAASLRTADEAEAALLRRRLIESNLRLVVSLARKLAPPGVPLLGLIQEGNHGLQRAAEQFDATRGYRFSTLATWWVRDSIVRAIGRRGT